MKTTFLAPRVSNAVSADGSRVYWSAAEWVSEEEVPKALYVRENDTQPESEVEEGVCTQPGLACTVQVDAAQAACSEAVCGKGNQRGGHGSFLTASADGSRVLFTDERRLTADSTAAAGAPDLYQYDLGAPEGERLADLSVDETSGEHANVEGILGSSEDGSYVYFAAGGVLAANQGVGGETATPQACDVSARVAVPRATCMSAMKATRRSSRRCPVKKMISRVLRRPSMGTGSRPGAAHGRRLRGRAQSGVHVPPGADGLKQSAG